MRTRTRWTVGSLALTGALLAAAALSGPGSARAQEGAEDEEDRERFRRHVEVVGPDVAFQFGSGSWLGVAIEDVDEEAVTELGLPEERGVRVREVVEESPAAEAGLEEGDVIWSWNGDPVESVAELRRLVGETPAGRGVRLGVYRDGSVRELTAELGEPGRTGMRRMMRRLAPRMDSVRVRLRGMEEEELERLHERLREFEGPERDRIVSRSFLGAPRVRLGVELRDLTEGLEEYFGVAGRGGALIADVDEDSPAAEAGLQAGDVVISVGDEEVSDPSDAIGALRDREPGNVEVRVIRRGEERTVTVELEEREGSDFRGGAALAPGARLRTGPGARFRTAPGPRPRIAPGPRSGATPSAPAVPAPPFRAPAWPAPPPAAGWRTSRLIVL